MADLSEALDEDRPKNFANFIRASGYGIAESFAADKRTLTQYRRFTGRTEGLSISFEAHLLGEKIEFDQARATLIFMNLPTRLMQQLQQEQN